MDSLYVCHFSNGHIKVGRSVDPMARIAAHAERVSCLGVDLTDHRVFSVLSGPSHIATREAALIAKCAEVAESRSGNEWFAGVSFFEACEWAETIIREEYDDLQLELDNGIGVRISQARRARNLSQSELGRGMRSDGGDITKATVSHWETNRYEPNLHQLRALCERLGVSSDYLIGIEGAQDGSRAQ